MKEIQSIVHALNSAGTPAVLATLVSVTGSSYRRPGARLLVLPDGSRIGSISGGCLEGDVLARAARVMETGLPETVRYDTTSENDLIWGVGLGCRGVVDILIERLPSTSEWARVVVANIAARRPTRLAMTFRTDNGAVLGTRLADSTSGAPGDGQFLETVLPPPMLAVFGAGDNARPLVRLAAEWGWAVTVADPRAALVTDERFPDAHDLVVAPIVELVERVSPESNALVVVMTHRYDFDVCLLRDLLVRPLAYLGIQGPRKRTQRILAELGESVERDGSLDQCRLHSPIGLDIGAETSEQIAVAIIAEMQSVLTGRNARPLHERAQPIHA